MAAARLGGCLAGCGAACLPAWLVTWFYQLLGLLSPPCLPALLPFAEEGAHFLIEKCKIMLKKSKK